MYFCVLCIVCFVTFPVLFVCTEQLPPGGYSTAVEYVSYHITDSHCRIKTRCVFKFMIWNCNASPLLTPFMLPLIRGPPPQAVIPWWRQVGGQTVSVGLFILNLALDGKGWLASRSGRLAQRHLCSWILGVVTIFFAVVPRPNAGHGLLILEVSRSNTTTHLSR